jgi:glycosyltransferase involved in cell wall biosynthesis
MVNAGSFNKYSSFLYQIFRPFFQFLLRKSKIKVTKWVAVSAETKDFMINNYGIKDKIELIPLGYNEKTCFYDPVAAENWRLKSGLPSNYKYVLYIGKCDKYKNPIDLFASFKRFHEKRPDFALLIVGEVSEEYRSAISQKAASLEISDKVFIKPPVNNLEIKKVLSLARMVIWPHGSSMTMLEAMACNCPVIASEIEVNRERLSDGRGLMFKNLENDLITQMDTLEQKREDIILNAKKWVSQFTWESINRQFLKDLD